MSIKLKNKHRDEIILHFHKAWDQTGHYDLMGSEVRPSGSEEQLFQYEEHSICPEDNVSICFSLSSHPSPTFGEESSLNSITYTRSFSLRAEGYLRDEVFICQICSLFWEI